MTEKAVTLAVLSILMVAMLVLFFILAGNPPRDGV